MAAEDLLDLAIFRFFLICESKGHFGGFGGGGGRAMFLLVAVAYLMRDSLTDWKRTSNKALDGVIV